MMLSELLPDLAQHADDITLIRSMVSEHSNHEQAIWYFNTGTTMPGRPSMGSWITYALGSETQDLPAFVAILNPKGLPVDGVRNFSNGWLPPVYQGFAMRAEGTPVLELETGRSCRRSRRAFESTPRTQQAALQRAHGSTRTGSAHRQLRAWRPECSWLQARR